MAKLTPRPRDAKLNAETLTAQALGHVDPVTRGLVGSIHPATTYERDKDGGYSSGRGYTRPHNPTYDEPENLLNALEGGNGTLLFASGMAAATAVFQSLLPGDHVVAPRVMYWSLRKWLIESAMSWGLDVEFVDTGDPGCLRAAMRPGQTRLIWLETPANPTWEVSDIEVASAIAHNAGARLAVDSTVASPVLSRPLELGADLVVHSATKYLNGHSDVLAGAVVTRRQDAFWNRIKAWRRDGGAVLGPFEAWLLLRGMRTLFVRMSRCSQSAMRIAEHFSGHPSLLAVLYPGLPDHPGHAIAARQMHGGFSGMLSLRLRGGKAAAMATAARVELFKRATSLGGMESLIEHRASIEGPATPVPDDLLRLSIGLEHVDDLIADLEMALDHDVSDPASDIDNTRTGQNEGWHSDLARLVREQLQPIVVERGGQIELDNTDGHLIQLRVSGSLGAALPLRPQIGALIRHYVDTEAVVEFVSEGTDSIRLQPGANSLESCIRYLLDKRINPALAAPGGEAHLNSLTDGVAHLSLRGGCQGCAMADVTMRQGIEVVLKEAFPELIAVVDDTDHSLGENPHFKTKKGV